MSMKYVGLPWHYLFNIVVYCLAIWFFIADTNCALAQVSSLQQLPPSSGNQNPAPANLIQSLFSNPAAANMNSTQEANPYGNSPYSYSGGVPQFPSNFWGGVFNRKIIDVGTVLTGTLEDDISSKASKTGDVFSILLQDGYKQNNDQLIPQNAKIVGTVASATPSSTKSNGAPGSLQVSLQSLVLPDGRSVPINAIIQYNPNQSNKTDIKKGRGIPVGEYAHSIEYGVVATAGALTRTMGLPLPVKTQTGGGNEFVVKKGELLPVKLTQPLDITTFANAKPLPLQTNTPAQNNLPAQIHWLTPNGQSPNMPSSGPNGAQTFGVPPYSNFPDASNNMLPGNASPAGPEPF